jgi:hypothetical protein
MSLELIHEQILIALKKFNLETADWDKFFHGYIYHKPCIIDEKGDMEEGYFNLTILTPNKYVYGRSKNKDKEVYIGVNFLISMGDRDDHENENKFYLKRIDVEWVEIENKHLFPRTSNFWDRSGWKHYSPLKTNEINEKTIDTIIKYIIGIVDKVFKMMDRDRQEIYDIFNGNEVEGGDPLLYGRKDSYWYAGKITKEIR